MKGSMKAAVLYKPLDLRLEEVDIPDIGSSEVLVKMKCVGICGSDVHFYLNGRIGSIMVEKPLILGHECSGEVVEVGPGVTRLRIRQRVVIEPGFVCGKCAYCREGRYNLCREIRFYGTPPVHGAFAEYVTAAEQNVYPMPGNMSYEEGAMIEPLAVGMMAAKQGAVSVNDTVVILGAGPIGLMALQAVRAHGVLETYVTDIIDYRLEYAAKFGAKAVIDSTKRDVVKEVLDLTEDRGVDVVVEASGATTAIQQAFNIAKPGGRIVLVGYPTADVPLPLTKVIVNELDIRGVRRYANVFPTAIRCVASGKVDVKSFVTHRFPFEKISEGFKTHSQKIGNPMKVQVVF